MLWIYWYFLVSVNVTDRQIAVFFQPSERHLCLLTFIDNEFPESTWPGPWDNHLYGCNCHICAEQKCSIFQSGAFLIYWFQWGLKLVCFIFANNNFAEGVHWGNWTLNLSLTQPMPYQLTYKGKLQLQVLKHCFGIIRSNMLFFSPLLQLFLSMLLWLITHLTKTIIWNNNLIIPCGQTTAPLPLL